MMKKLLLITMLALLYTIQGYAQSDHLYVHTNSGAQSFKLDGLRKITFTAANIVVQPKSGAAAEFAFDAVRKLTFESSGNRLSPASLPLLSIRYNPQSGSVVLSGNKPLGRIEVYNLQGLPVRSAETESPQAEIPLSDVPAGVYIVRTAGQVTKIVKH
jgi:hypothetical protein